MAAHISMVGLHRDAEAGSRELRQFTDETKTFGELLGELRATMDQMTSMLDCLADARDLEIANIPRRNQFEGQPMLGTLNVVTNRVETMGEEDTLAIIPAESTRIKVTMVSCQSLRDADHIPGLGASDPYCVCEIRGNSHQGSKRPAAVTGIIENNNDPVWNAEHILDDFHVGDDLVFSVYDKDVLKPDDLLGRSLLKSDQFYPDGFEGDLTLSETQNDGKSTLKVIVRIEPPNESKIQTSVEEVNHAHSPSHTLISQPETTQLLAVVSSSNGPEVFLPDDAEVKRLLEERADPNADIGNFICFGNKFCSGSPLAVAALMGRKALVMALLQHGANPDSTYSRKAGAAQILWTGTAAQATIPNGRLDILKELVHGQADVHTASSNGASLVWNAAYFGQVSIAEYLLDFRVDIEAKAESQDDKDLSYTPLHSAANHGRGNMVALLLDAQASLTATDGRGHRPLDDAVLQGHSDVVKLLVASSADIFRHVGDIGARAPSGIKLSMLAGADAPLEAPRRCIDLMFSRENPVLTAAVAQALKAAPDLLQKLPTQDLVRFLRTPGTAPLHIMNSILQPYLISYWDDRSGRIARERRTTAYVNRDLAMNIVVGPHNDKFVELFNAKTTLPEELRKFVDNLGPAEPTDQCRMFLPVSFFMCHVPFVHEDIDVLLAMSSCPQEAIFSLPACKGILQVMWRQVHRTAKLLMLMSFVEVLNLVLINCVMNGFFSDERSRARFNLSNYLALCVWFLCILLEIVQFRGYLQHGLCRQYLTDTANWFDVTVIFLTGCVLITACQRDFDFEAKNAGYRTVLGIIVYCKWVRLLMSMSQFKAVGTHILPIFSTIGEIGPFCAVLAVYFIGAVNMYYALGIHNFSKSFLIIFSMVVLGEVEMHELENVPEWGLKLQADNTIDQTEPQDTSYFWIVRFMMVFISFVLGVALMNIFIAVLCFSYDRAYKEAPSAFLRNRGQMLVRLFAIHRGIQSFSRRSCPTCCVKKEEDRLDRLQPVGPTSSNSSVKETLSGRDIALMEDSAYMWICCHGMSEPAFAPPP